MKRHQRFLETNFAAVQQFSLQAQHLPKHLTTFEIKEFVEGLKKERYSCYSVNKVYDIYEFYQKIRESFKIDNKIKDLQKREKTEQRSYKRMIERKIKIENELKQIESNYISNKDQFFTGKAFIIFRYRTQRNEFYQRFKRGVHFSKSHKVFFVKPESPTDIFWENYEFPTAKKLFRRFLSVLFALVYIVAGGVAITVLKFAQLKSANSLNIFVVYVLAFVISLIIGFVNYTLRIASYETSFYEKHSTYFRFETSYLGKMLIFFFLNTTIVILIAQLLVEDFSQFYKQNGLGNQLAVLMLVNAFGVPLLTFFDPFHFLIKVVKQKYRAS